MATPRKPKSLQQAMDQAANEINADYLRDIALQEQDRETGRVWARWGAAEKAAGPEAIVLPIALAKDVLRLLSGEPTSLPVAPNVIAEMVQGHIDRAGERT
jgi:hypothetical protein